MNVGIIGAGNIGGTIAAKLATAGHSVKLAGSKGPEAIREQAERIGAIPVAARDAVKGVDVVILSIPFATIPEIAEIFADVPPELPVIDTTNYYPQRDGQIIAVDEGKAESVWVSDQLGRPVIKAFNAVLSHTLKAKGKAQGLPNRIAIPVAGDDPSAKRVAFDIVNIAGFDAYDAGTLAESWRQQPGSPAYCTELTVDELGDALASAAKDRLASARDAVIKEIMESAGARTHEESVTRNRQIAAGRA